MIRQSVVTGLTRSTSSIQREVIQAHGHSGSNQNWTSSRSAESADMFPSGPVGKSSRSEPTRGPAAAPPLPRPALANRA